MKKRLFTSLFAWPLVLSLISCTASPTAPSLDGLNNTTSPAATALRWDMIAPGCSPRSAPSPLPDTAAARFSRPVPTSLNASWDWTSPGQRAVTLYAQFHDVNGQWALCSWDTADV